jgi:hypothetical protein
MIKPFLTGFTGLLELSYLSGRKARLTYPLGPVLCLCYRRNQFAQDLPEPEQKGF